MKMLYSLHAYNKAKKVNCLINSWNIEGFKVFALHRFSFSALCTGALRAPMHAPLQNRRFCSEAHPSGVQEAQGSANAALLHISNGAVKKAKNERSFWTFSKCCALPLQNSSSFEQLDFFASLPKGENESVQPEEVNGLPSSPKANTQLLNSSQPAPSSPEAKKAAKQNDEKILNFSKKREKALFNKKLSYFSSPLRFSFLPAFEKPIAKELSTKINDQEGSYSFTQGKGKAIEQSLILEEKSREFKEEARSCQKPKVVKGRSNSVFFEETLPCASCTPEGTGAYMAGSASASVHSASLRPSSPLMRGFLDKSDNFQRKTTSNILNMRNTEQDSKLVQMEYSLETFQRSNQDTCLTHKPSVFEGTWVQSGDLLTDCASSVGGELSLGQNLLIAYMPWEGYNFEDAILISERLVRDDLYTSVHIERYELETLRPPKTSAESKQQTKGRSGAEEITRNIPDVSEKEIQKLDSYGIIKRGSWVEEGDILVGKITPINKKTISPYQKLLYTILEKQVKPIKDSSLRAPKGIKAKVVDIKYFLRKRREPMRNLTKSTTSQSRTTLVKEQFKNQRFACTDACTDARSAPMHAPLQNRRFCSEAHPSGVQEALQKSEIFVRSARSASARSAPSQKAKLFDKTAFFLKTRSCQKPKVVKGRSNAVFFEETLQGQKRSASVASVHQKPLHQKPTIFGRSELLFEKKNKQSFLVPRSSATLQITAPVQKSTIFVAFKKQSLKKRFINSLLKTLAKSSTVNLLGVQKSHVNRQFWKSAFLLYKQKMNNNKKLDFVLLNFFKKFKKKPLRSTLPKGPVQALRFAFRKKTTFFERKQTERPSPKFGKKGKLPILSLISGSGNKRKGYSKSSAFAFGGASLAPSFFASPLEIRKAQQFKKNCVIVEKRRARKSEIIQNIETIHIYLAEKRKVQVGDKMAGRHGNKGIVSQILPIQDMPYLPDGTPIDMVLNPLGVPSRMNVGQIYECLLGLAGKYLGENYKIPSFDEAYGADASRSFVFNKLFQARMQTGANWLFDPNSPGKMRLYDGRNGECFLQPVTVGQAYILRLVHMVDDKIHARSTGPYSLVTQQPLRGRSKQGGQRLGEMEVWALEGYGAAFTLLEMLTIKSDDMTGRMTLWSNLILNKDIAIGTPESFKVLVCELQALCLDIGLFRYSQPMSHAPSATPQLSAPEGSEAAKQGKGNDFNKFSLREINSLINLP